MALDVKLILEQQSVFMAWIHIVVHPHPYVKMLAIFTLHMSSMSAIRDRSFKFHNVCCNWNLKKQWIHSKETKKYTRLLDIHENWSFAYNWQEEWNEKTNSEFLEVKFIKFKHYIVTLYTQCHYHLKYKTKYLQDTHTHTLKPPHTAIIKNRITTSTPHAYSSTTTLTYFIFIMRKRIILTCP